MKCLICGSAMKKSKEKLYHYSISGLSNVYLKDIEFNLCSNPECGETEVGITNMLELNEIIAHDVATKKAKLLPEEIRFLRKQLGLSGADFARVLAVAPETVSRWENGSLQMKEMSEKFIRFLILARTAPLRKYDELDDVAKRLSKTTPRRVFKKEKGQWRGDSAA
jgi:putative zinc finger/helix-turn-helix YgiT family protein